eukprot:s2140_g7.t1
MQISPLLLRSSRLFPPDVWQRLCDNVDSNLVLLNPVGIAALPPGSKMLRVGQTPLLSRRDMSKVIPEQRRVWVQSCSPSRSVCRLSDSSCEVIRMWLDLASSGTDVRSLTLSQKFECTAFADACADAFFRRLSRGPGNIRHHADKMLEEYGGIANMELAAEAYATLQPTSPCADSLVGTGRMAGLVSVSGGRCGSHALHRIASRLARHVVAAQPRFLHVGSVPAETLRKEREVFKAAYLEQLGPRTAGLADEQVIQKVLDGQELVAPQTGEKEKALPVSEWLEAEARSLSLAGALHVEDASNANTSRLQASGAVSPSQRETLIVGHARRSGWFDSTEDLGGSFYARSVPNFTQNTQTHRVDILEDMEDFVARYCF